MMDTSCIFCLIANGEIPARTVCENDHFRVILDNSPASEGHALVLPKAHYRDLMSIPPELAGEAMEIASRVARLYQERLGCTGLNLIQNNGEIAGQTVHHFHLHIIPRYKGGPKMLQWKPGSPSPEQLDSTLARILGGK